MAGNVSEKEVTVSKILGQFTLGDKDFSSGRWRFDVVGASFPDIRDKLVKALARHLDPNKQSCVSYIGKDGIFTILVRDGEVLCS
jgi:2-phospho-L-lactate transferase/gluconeogenesis factor (CofD/UPF0052 family)